MTLTRGFIRNAVTTPLDARLMDMGGLVCNADGSPRAGVLGGANPSIVTALATMNVAVAAAEFVTTKGKADGAAIFTNDGTVNVAIGAAPASNSRIDVIYVKHNDNTTGDADSNPIFGVRAGVAAASPTKPAIPTGALELATLRVYAGTTAANGGSNTLVNTYAMTAARGGVVPFRTKTELDAWTTACEGQQAIALATEVTYERRGSAWIADMPKRRIVTATASGSLGAGTTVDLAPAVTIPASPFGVGIPYDLVVDVWSAAVANSGVSAAVIARVDGGNANANHYSSDMSALAGGSIYPAVHSRTPITNPDVTHTAVGQISAVGGSIVVSAAGGSPALSGFAVYLERVETI